MSVIGLGGGGGGGEGGCKKESAFSTFSNVFLRTFTISRYFPLLNK